MTDLKNGDMVQVYVTGRVVETYPISGSLKVRILDMPLDSEQYLWVHKRNVDNERELEERLNHD